MASPMRLPSNLRRGQVYVLRMVGGNWMPLRLAQQSHYREWIGCFSAI